MILELPSPSERWQLLSINVHRLGDHVKCSNVIGWLRTRKESVIFLQETYFSDPADTNFLKSIWKGSIFSSFGGKHSRGVTTLIKESLSVKNSKITHGNCGRWVNVTTMGRWGSSNNHRRRF